MTDVIKELEEMNKMFNGEIDPSTEEPSTGTPSTESPSTTEPTTEQPSTEAPSTTAPSTELPDDRDQVIADLRTRLSEFETKKKSPTTLPPPSFEDHDFLGDIDSNELVDDPKKFNELLNKIYKQAVLDTEKMISSRLPTQVRTTVDLVSNLKAASDKFYESNPDLEPFKGAVASVFDELSSVNPDKPYSEVLTLVGEETRKRLGIKKPPIKSDDPKPPRLPNKKTQGRRGTEQKSNPLLDEIELMNKSLRGY